MIPAATTPTVSTLLAGAGASRVTATLQDACGQDPSWLCHWVYERTGSNAWASFADWFVSKPVTILLIVVGAWVVNRIVGWLIRRSMRRLSDPAHRERVSRLRERTPALLLRTDQWSLRTEARVSTLTAVFRSLAGVVIWFVAFVWIVGVLGINLAPLIAGAGIAGIALGFGTQTMVKDFIAGFFLIVEDQFGVGDVVDLGGGAAGTVERITLRATRLRDVEGTVWHVGNGQLTYVANKSQEWARALIDVVVRYDADLETVQALISRVADEMAAEPEWAAELLEEPSVWGVEALAADGIHVRLVIKTRPGSQWTVLRELRLRLKRSFDEAGITLAYNFANAPTEVVLHPAEVTLRDEREADGDTVPADGDGDGDGSSDSSGSSG